MKIFSQNKTFSLLEVSAVPPRRHPVQTVHGGNA